MRSVPAEDVRAWRAASHHLSHTAGALESAMDSVHSFASELTAHLSLSARLDEYDPRGFHERTASGGEWTLYSGPTMEVRLLPATLLPALLACDAFRRESRLSRRKAAAEREAAVRRWGPRVLELLDPRPLRLSEVQARLSREPPNPGFALELERTLHALVGRGELKMATAPSPSARPFDDVQYAFWKPEGRERVEAAPREGWVFLQDLALHYFRTAGPATRDDLAWWLNISFSAARRTIEDLAGTLEEVDIAGHKQAHFMIEEAAAELRSGRIEPSRRVALLPKMDPEACWSREGFSRVVDPELAHWLSPRGKAARGGRPRVVQPVMVGGKLAGSWRWDGNKGRVQVDFFAPPLEEVEEEANRRGERLGSLLERQLPALAARARRATGTDL